MLTQKQIEYHRKRYAPTKARNASKRRAFIDTWNQCDSMDEVSAKTGKTKTAASSLACYYRRKGLKLKAMPQPSESRLERLCRRSERCGDCIVWTGSKNEDGYGYTALARGKTQLVHRMSYEEFVEPIPDGMNVCHSCDNPACINPDHLWVGTQADNVQDMCNKGRHWRHNGN